MQEKFVGAILGAALFLIAYLAIRTVQKLKSRFLILVEIRDLLAKQRAEPVVAITEEEKQALLALPKLVEGWIGISKEQVVQTAKMTEAVAAFRKTLFRSEGGDFHEYHEEDASRESELQQILKERGGSREDAEAILQNRSVWEGLKIR